MSKRSLPVDRFKRLADSELCRIISFLPTTREAVATSILSKRWEKLWTRVENFNFENHSHGLKEKQFPHFVNSVLIFHKGSIKSMRLSSSTRLSEYDIRTWIDAAVYRGVESLDLDLVHFNFRWPWSLFNSKTLVDLKLVHVDFTDLYTPSAPFFPSLQKLHIEPALYSLYDPEPLTKFILGCSALEHLFLRIESIGPCYISSSTLKKLDLYYRHYGDDSRDMIMLAVPALELLKVKCLPCKFFVEDQLTSLVEVDICFLRIGVSNEDICRESFERFLQLISSVKVLRLKCWFTQPLSLPLNPQFHNFTKLNILSTFFEWSLVGSLMQSSANLESITLEQTCPKYHDKDRQVWNDPQDVPHCLLSSLTMVSIIGYGIEDELDMVTYVLENSEVVSVEIRCLGQEDDSDLLKKIAMMKGSSRCQISFA